MKLAVVLFSVFALLDIRCWASNVAMEEGAFDFQNGYLGEPKYSLQDFDSKGMDDEEANDEETNDYDNGGSEDEPASKFLNQEMLASMYQGKSMPSSAPSVDSNKQRSYCHPPNPCPKGYTPEKNGCDAGVMDTADWNKLHQERDMKSGKCACDIEHMFTCPKNVPHVSVATAKQASQQQQHAPGNNKQQRSGSDEKEVAKKSPVMTFIRRKRDTKADDMMDFSADDHKVVAKKGHA